MSLPGKDDLSVFTMQSPGSGSVILRGKNIPWFLWKIQINFDALMHWQTGCGEKTQRDVPWRKTANKTLSLSDTAPLSTRKQPSPGHGGQAGKCFRNQRINKDAVSPTPLPLFPHGRVMPELPTGHLSIPTSWIPLMVKRTHDCAQLGWRKDRHELGAWRRENSASFFRWHEFYHLFSKGQMASEPLNHFLPSPPCIFSLWLSFFFIVPQTQS